MQIHTPKKTNDEVKTKRYIFSPVSDVDVEKWYLFFFNVELEIRHQQFLVFLSFMSTFPFKL